MDMDCLLFTHNSNGYQEVTITREGAREQVWETLSRPLSQSLSMGKVSEDGCLLTAVWEYMAAGVRGVEMDREKNTV